MIRIFKFIMLNVLFCGSLVAQNRSPLSASLGVGYKNSFGAFNGQLGFALFNKANREIFNTRLGAGISESLGIGVGLDGVIVDKKNSQLKISIDYTCQFKGVLEYRNDTVVDIYDFNQMNYLSPYLSYSFLPGTGTIGAFKFKIGYTLPLNVINITHTYGPVVNMKYAIKSIEGGVLIGFDFVLYI